MKTRSRTVFIIMGLLLTFMASILIINNRPFLQMPVDFPSPASSRTLLYLMYLHVVKVIWGPRLLSVLIANGALVLAISLLVFYLGWKLANPLYRFMGAAASVLLFQINPLIILLPMSLGVFGGSLLAPILLLGSFSVMLMIENWSGFMCGIVCALLWALILWVHVPTAVLLALSMVPWVIFSRRPLVRMGIALTMVLLGGLVFSISWMGVCLLMRRWLLTSGPMEAARALGHYIQSGLSLSLVGDLSIVLDRFVRLLGWISPFLFILGLWAIARSLRRMVQERRSSVFDLAALTSLWLLGVILTTGDKVTLPGAWYVLMLLSLWSPLIASDLALKENFYSRCFRYTALIAFVVTGITLWAKLSVAVQSSTPDIGTLGSVLLAVLVSGGLSLVVFRKHPLTTGNRIRATLAGATLAYGLVMDCFLFR